MFTALARCWRAPTDADGVGVDLQRHVAEPAGLAGGDRPARVARRDGHAQAHVARGRRQRPDRRIRPAAGIIGGRLGGRSRRDRAGGLGCGGVASGFFPGGFCGMGGLRGVRSADIFRSGRRSSTEDVRRADPTKTVTIARGDHPAMGTSRYASAQSLTHGEGLAWVASPCTGLSLLRLALSDREFASGPPSARALILRGQAVLVRWDGYSPVSARLAGIAPVPRFVAASSLHRCDKLVGNGAFVGTVDRLRGFRPGRLDGPKDGGPAADLDTEVAVDGHRGMASGLGLRRPGGGPRAGPGLVGRRSREASAQAGVPGAEANGTIAFTSPTGGSSQLLYLIDTRSQSFAVYRVDPQAARGAGAVKLEAARQYRYDLKLSEYNNLPPEVSSVEAMIRNIPAKH